VKWKCSNTVTSLRDERKKEREEKREKVKEYIFED
jgi:hypothetical protein